jgi:ribosomal protein S12 methylthiotransferase
MPKPSVSFVSLGCPKNLVDSEKMLGLLAEAGCPVVAAGLEADVLVVNTCGFLAASRDEAIGVLREAAEQNRAGRVKRIVVAGCLVQRDGRTLAEQVPEIDALVGVNNRNDIVRAVIGERTHRRGTDNAGPRPSRLSVASPENRLYKPVGSTTSAARVNVDPLVYLADYHPLKAQQWSDRARLRLTPSHYAYVRVSEGCDQKCTFCTIPSIRGPMHCKTPDHIADECRELIDDGVVEIILIGQDTTSYGRDIGYAPGLAGLLRTLDRLDGARWIRLMYVYPTDLTDEMIDAIAECPHLVKYIDIPLQHINDRILKAMHRRVTRRETERLLARLRDRIPGVAIRTTFIVGFPGETDAEFEELCAFVRDFGFDNLGAFTYSREPETPAGRMNNQIDDAVKQTRLAALMQTQQPIAFRKAAVRNGQAFQVLIDDFGRDGVYPARHAGQAPEIDGLTYVHGGELEPGQFIQVCGTGNLGYDVIARPVSGGLTILR